MGEEEVDLTAVDIPEVPPTDEMIAKRLELLKLQEATKLPLPDVVPEPPGDIGKLSTAAPRDWFTVGEPSPAKDLAVRPAQSNIPPEAMALLDTIATREAEPAFDKSGKRAGWTTIVGGERFDPNTNLYPKHAYPQLRGFVGGAGRSYAAGRYQETGDTYYENVARSQRLHPGVEVRGWSEDAQNIRNWDKAQEVYKRYVEKNPQSGLSGDLLKDLTTHRGDPNTIGRMSRALGSEWTSAPGGREGNKITGGKESYYGSTFLKMLANVPGMTRDDLNEFMNQTPEALQKRELEGGLSNTPERAAQIAALANGTSIEKIKAAAEIVRTAGARGTGVVPPSSSARTSRVTYTDMPRGVIPGAEGTTPNQDIHAIPGMETSDYSLTKEAVNPSVLSTILAHQEMNKPLPEIKAPGDVAQEMSLMDKIKFITKNFTPAGLLAGGGDSRIAQAAVEGVKNAIEGGPQDATALWDAAKGGVAGVAQMPINMITGPLVTGVGGAGLLLDDPNLKKWAFQIAQSQQDWADYTRRDLGLDPESGAGKVGQFIGSIVPSAHASTVFGQPPIVIQTASGPKIANDATLNSMVIGGGAALGFGLGLSQSGRMIRYARENPVFRKYTDPTRDVAGNIGVTASSLPVDVFKASTVNPMQAIIDTVDRGARYQNQVNTRLGGLVGINKGAANEVYQRMRVQTRSGAENLAGQALTEGVLNTQDFKFNVDVPLAVLHKFSEMNRDFPNYLRLRAIQDEIQANQNYNIGVPNAKGTAMIRPQTPRPETFNDHQNTTWDDHTVAREIAGVEQANPKFTQAYRDYQANLAETRRFVSDGPHAPENRRALDTKAMERPTLPIFSDTQKTDMMFNRILNGDNPLRYAETNIKKGIMRAMSHDADRRYINFSRGEVPTSFREVTHEWVRDEGQTAKADGAILRRKHDGGYRYWVGDPFVVSVLNNDSAPVTTLGKGFATSKRLFEHTTTGMFAPWFPITALTRSIGQGFVTAPPISRRGIVTRAIGPAGPLSSAVGFGMNVGPRMMNRMAVPTVKWFEDIMIRNGMGNMLGANTHLMSKTLHQAYINSFYNRMKQAGAFGPDSMNYLSTDTAAHITRARAQVSDPHLRAILDTMMYSDRLWAKFLRGVSGKPASAAFEGYNATREAFSEAGSFGWAYKAHGKGIFRTGRGAVKDGRLLSDAEVAAMMRDYTGDPMIKGNPYSRSMEGFPDTLRFSGTKGMFGTERRAQKYVNAGKALQGWRMMTPWAGVLVQSPAATLAALRDNPIRANIALTMSAVMPEIMAYMWNMANGPRAINYAMDERGDHRVTNSIYLFDPRYPNEPWKGWEIPMPQEFIFPRAATRSFAHQYMGRSANTVYEELWGALKSFYFGGVQPPVPPLATGVLGLSGIATPEGYLNMRQKRENPFSPTKNENSIELAWRNLMPTIADVSIAAMTAGWESPNAKWEDFNPKTSAKGAGYRLGSRVPIIGTTGRLPASSTKTDDLFKYQRDIDNMSARYSKWERDQGAIDPSKGRGTSEEGRARIQKFVGPAPPTEGWSKGKIPLEGIVPKSGNPLYDMFMKQMATIYTSDSPDKGGIGYRSLWKNLDIYKKKLEALDATHAGTEALYIEKMKTKMPKTRAYLEKNGIDPYNYRDVRDFYANRVVQAQQRILETIQATEQMFNKDPRIRKMLKPGQQFSLQMLNPNKPGLDTSE